MFSLLSLLLVGCTSELDRCIEANLKPPNPSETHIWQIDLNCKAVQGGPFGKAEGESAEQCIDRRNRQYADELEQYAIEDAKKVCNSQGIY